MQSGLKVELLPAMGAGLACVVVTVLGGLGYLLICSTYACAVSKERAFIARVVPTGISAYRMLGALIRRALRFRERPIDISEWHRWVPIFPVRDGEGIWRMPDEVWRRQRNGAWEYCHRPPTEEELLDRQW